MKVEAITLTTKEGQEVKLGVDEARALYAQLRELFGERDRPQYIPVPAPYPMPVYPPVIIRRDITSPWISWRPSWEVTCGTARLNTSDTSGLLVSYSGRASD